MYLPKMPPPSVKVSKAMFLILSIQEMPAVSSYQLCKMLSSLKMCRWDVFRLCMALLKSYMNEEVEQQKSVFQPCEGYSEFCLQKPCGGTKPYTI